MMRVQHIAERYITVAEAARRLHVGINYVYTLLYGGQLAGNKVGKQWQVDSKAVEERRLRLAETWRGNVTNQSKA